LTAENYDKRKRRWVNPKRKRNEALDTLVYAAAATMHPWLRLDVATEARWRDFEQKLTINRAAPPPPTRPGRRIGSIGRSNGWQTQR
jgi:phage terminase large subunit GpA-like protein